LNYLIDTDWVADFLADRRNARPLLLSLRPSGLAISSITYGEIYDGVYGGRDPHPAERTFQQFLRVTPVLLTRPIMRRFALLRAGLRRQNQSVADPDLLIAATALHFGRTPVTRNLRGFACVPGLMLHTTQ
jgi:predicted nucleic acid-binding protein